MNLGVGVVPRRTNLEYPKIGSNKRADEGNCEVGT
jgi:hypothetical protein